MFDVKYKLIIKNCKKIKNIQKLKIDVYFDTEFYKKYNLIFFIFYK